MAPHITWRYYSFQYPVGKKHMEFLITDSVGLEGGMLEEAPEGRRFEEDCNRNQFGIGKKEQTPSANPFLSPFMRVFGMRPKKDASFFLGGGLKKTKKTRFVTLLIFVAPFVAVLRLLPGSH